MYIKKILNNNFAIVDGEHEMVVMGVGIAFNKKVGDKIEEYEIEKKFQLSNSELSFRLQELLVDVPLNIVKITEEIITNIKVEMGKKVNDVIYITLIDHINSALDRNKNGIPIINNLLYDIQRFYPQEYTLGIEAVNKINKAFQVELTDDEAGFIALHIVNATTTDASNTISYRITKLMKEILSIVRNFYQIDLDEKSLYYYRFVNHLRFFGQRMFGDTSNISNDDHLDLLEIIIEKYPSAYLGTLKIEEFLLKNYDTQISSEEKMYLTIHIQRILDEYYKKEEEENGKI